MKPEANEPLTKKTFFAQWGLGKVFIVIVIMSLAAYGLVKVFYSKNTPASTPAPASAPVASAPAGFFKASAEQLASFQIETIVNHNFYAKSISEGKIAINLDQTTSVYSPYSGSVSAVMATLGETVKMGQPLLAVKATEFVQGQNDLIAGNTAINTARAQVKQAEISEQRKHSLYEARAGALQDWQQSQADLAVAQSSLKSAETALTLAKNKLRILGKSEADISALEGAQQGDPLAYVVAPISGTVTDRQVGTGQYIQAGATNAVYTIGNLNTVWLVANVRETEAPKMRLGARIEVRVLALPDRVFKATLSYIAASVDPLTRRVGVRAVVDNPQGLLKPEMFAKFSIATGPESLAPGVDEKAIVYEGDKANVWIVKDADLIQFRAIQVGRAGDGVIEVLKGLQVGEKVVTHGTLFIDRAIKTMVPNASH